MEMEDHHHHHQQQQYAMSDLRQLVNNGPRSTHFPSILAQTPTAELFPGHRNLTPNPHPHHHQHYEMMTMFGHQVSDIMPRCLHEFASPDSAAAVAATNNANSITVAAASTPTTTGTSASTPPLSGLEAETAACGVGGDASTGRWPRQETLTLLEIRSRLDPKFKEANQKGPLWDEVSRIMSEEHGYQRSGKKCREKFENLYKYYKKTKEGKAGRQDGKHYRFFRQLEALYGENSNPNSVLETNFGTNNNNNLRFQTTSSHTPSQTLNQDLMFQSHNNNKHCDSLSLTNSTEFETSSSDDDNDSMDKRRKRRNWKVKIKDFIDSQMKKLMEKQEEWMEKLMRTLEQKEKERVLREEDWKRQETERLEREHKFWVKERAWMEARDAALMEALQKLTGRELKSKAKSHESPHDGLMVEAEIQNHSCENNQNNEDGSEILNSSTARGSGEKSWPESEIIRNAKELGNKKRKENSRSCFYFENNDQSSLYNQGSAYCCDMNDHQRQESNVRLQISNDGSSPSNSNVGNAVPAESCFPFLMSEGPNLWENYSLKLNKATQNQ